MKWEKELKRAIVTNPQFLVWGNVYDIYAYKSDETLIPLELNGCLSEILKDDYSLILYYEPIYGLKMLVGDEEKFKTITKENYNKDKSIEMSLSKFADLLVSIENQRKISVATIFNFTSRINEPFCCPKQVSEFYYKTFALLQESTPKKFEDSQHIKYSPLIFIFDKENDIPAWYITENPKIKSIHIPKPDYLERALIIKVLSNRISGYSNLEDDIRKKNEDLFIDETSKLYMCEIISIISLAVKERVCFSKIGEAINMYKLGIMENEWAKISIDKFNQSEELLEKRVIGQPNAIIKASDILKRAYFNLSGSQFSKNSNRPKGVMFFAGPTGVGKTELAKSITELVFGNENNYIRFDMSEFSQEHSNQRLVGAPPGYVGYEMGGELTNAIKENPFTVILFDEIEKAHPKIMDIFLQILDDGRITSSRGDTVYLSESIIIFTSNLGIYEITSSNERIENVNNSMEYEDIHNKILSSIQNHFKFKLQRPEILNRIGENIVVFDFIREENARKIFTKMLNSIIINLQENHKIYLEFKNGSEKVLEMNCIVDLTMGGRGIGNHIESIFINPLSRKLFELGAKENDTIVIEEIYKDDYKWALKANKKSI